MFIDFEGIVNVRELGGIPVAGGRRVKPGLLLRGAKLSDASPSDIERLEREFRIARVVDLRDATELKRHPDPEIRGASYHSLPALPGMPSEAPPSPETVAEPDFDSVFRWIYRELATGDVSAGCYREFFNILLSALGGAVYWHCTQGKDRTGVAAILLLTALGADEKDIREEYFLSNTGLRPLYDARDGNGWSDETWARLFFVYPEYVDNFFSAVGELYGGVEGYLRRRLGLSDSDLEKLREYYTY